MIEYILGKAIDLTENKKLVLMLADRVCNIFRVWGFFLDDFDRYYFDRKHS